MKVAVLIEAVSQSTDPSLPKPVCEAPAAKATVSPEAPSVTSVPHLLTI